MMFNFIPFIADQISYSQITFNYTFDSYYYFVTEPRRKKSKNVRLGGLRNYESLSISIPQSRTFLLKNIYINHSWKECHDAQSEHWVFNIPLINFIMALIHLLHCM